MTRSEPPRAPWRAGDQLPPLIARTATWAARSAVLVLVYRIGWLRGARAASLACLQAAFRGVAASVRASSLDPTPARDSIRAGRWL